MIEDIVCKVDRLVNYKSLLKKMGREGQVLNRERFSIEQKNRKVKEIYEQVLESLD